MPNLIFAKIDVKQIEKARLFQGEKGLYLDLVLVPTRESKYGDTHFITQSCSKEERLAGKKMPIIGNAKEQPPRGAAKSAPTDSGASPYEAKTEDKPQDDVPF